MRNDAVRQNPDRVLEAEGDEIVVVCSDGAKMQQLEQLGFSRRFAHLLNYAKKVKWPEEASLLLSTLRDMGLPFQEDPKACMDAAGAFSCMRERGHIQGKYRKVALTTVANKLAWKIWEDQ